MKSSLGVSDFLEEISSLSHSIVFLYFFALFTEEDFLISPCYSLELCIKWEYISFSPFLFASLLSQLFVRPPQIGGNSREEQPLIQGVVAAQVQQG